MTRSELIRLAHFRATSKPTTPTVGSKKYNQLVLAGKFFTDSFNNEPYTDWASQYDFRPLTATVTATDTFALDESIYKVSQQEGDYIRIVHTDDKETEYELISADRLFENKYNYVVAVVGRTLMFPREFTADDPQFGGTIIVPSYGKVEFPDTDEGTIDIDDPNWLVLMCAAELIRNDVTRKSEYPNLLGEAKVLMDKMKENAGARVDEIYRPNFLGGE